MVPETAWRELERKENFSSLHTSQRAARERQTLRWLVLHLSRGQWFFRLPSDRANDADPVNFEALEGCDLKGSDLKGSDFITHVSLA